MQTINELISRLNMPEMDAMIRPEYTGELSSGVFLGVESMRNHMTDEGWQIAQALSCNGYTLCGHNLTVNETNVRNILKKINPGIVVVQDKREWDVNPRDFRDKEARFNNIKILSKRNDIFTLTILKDAHQKPLYHRESAEEIGCHAWIVYYNPRIVKHVAPYVRESDLIRTYHSIDSNIIPAVSKERIGSILSGAISGVYPLRFRLRSIHHKVPDMTYLKHPGYHRNGSSTPAYLKILSQHKTSICTSSIYGYTLRKIIESTACGCRVFTDLPVDDVLPWIDGNLVRVHPDIPTNEAIKLIKKMNDEYDPARQKYFADQAKTFYDFNHQGLLLKRDIEQMRKNYNATNEIRIQRSRQPA